MSEWRKENIATMAIAALMAVGLYQAGAGGHAFWSLLLLLNLNYIKRANP
jgi:hypothetical protein